MRIWIAWDMTWIFAYFAAGYVHVFAFEAGRSSAQQFVHYKDRLLVGWPLCEMVHFKPAHSLCLGKIFRHIFSYIQNDCHLVFQLFYG